MVKKQQLWRAGGGGYHRHWSLHIFYWMIFGWHKNFCEIVFLWYITICENAMRHRQPRFYSTMPSPKLERRNDAHQFCIGLKIRQSSIWYAGSLGRTAHRPIVLCSLYYFFFHNFLQNSLQISFQFIFLFFYDFTKIKKEFWLP